MELEERTPEEIVERAMKQEVNAYAKSKLSCPEGVFKVRLAGNFGPKISSGGAVAIGLKFEAVAQAHYDDEGVLLDSEPEELRWPYRFSRDFYVVKKNGDDNEYAIRQINSLLHVADYRTQGEMNPETQRFEFDRNEALDKCVLDGVTAWTVITHKQDKNDPSRWNLELSDFTKKPRYRIKVTNGEA